MVNMPLTRREFAALTAGGILSSQWLVKPSAYAEAKATSPDSQPAETTRSVTLLHFTDTHAQLETHWDYLPGQLPAFQQMGGFARLKTAIDREIKASQGPVFVADGGDEFQGSGPAAWSRGEVILDPLNALGADVFVPGNWEPVYGPARFRELMSRLKAQVTCFNFHEKSTGHRIFPPASIIEKDGCRIAFVGLTDLKASDRHSPDEFAGLDTSRLNGLSEFLNDLKSKERVTLIVGLFHTGLTVARYLAREFPKFDIILSGHTHERTTQSIIEGKTIIVESAGMGSFLGRLDVELNAGNEIVAHRFRLIEVSAANTPENPVVKQLVDENLKPYRERANTVVGRTVTPIMRYDVLETSADDFITDALRDETNVDIAFSNGFRFGLPIPAGNITVGDLWNLLPMDARIKVGWVTGRQLKDYLENELELVYSPDPKRLSGGWGPRASGMMMRYSMRAGQGKRVQEVHVGGKILDETERYTVASCERSGEPLDVICRIRGVHDVTFAPQTIHQALITYFQKHPVISPSREGRAYADDLAPVVFSQDSILSEGQRGSYQAWGM
ncbi:hypothetical protein A6X21_12550 [Planctopirus hydrillae]|uniref:Bifunctional metallophosphatase/5'-nucleotidase n=2 Tax=Planctopirus hydrillae TaxID=1841610 RepID=A0A1C3E5J8_9PLAN|nr:hypothetical protein A6X21_12550 [Planctopirus hydrillae]